MKITKIQTSDELLTKEADRVKATSTHINNKGVDYSRRTEPESKKLSHDNLWGITNTEESTETVADVDKRSQPSVFVNYIGNLTENWSVIRTIPAKLIEVTANTVVLDCLDDFTINLHTERSFAKRLLEGYISLTYDMILIISQYERPGKVAFEFEEAKPGHDYSKYFDFPIDDEPIYFGNPFK